MRRRWGAGLVVVTLAALVLGACSRTAAPAARVNGSEVSQAQLWDAVALQEKLADVTGGAASSPIARGKLESSYVTSGVSEVLGGLVVSRILEQDLERLGLAVDDAAVDSVRAQVEQSPQDAQILQQLAPDEQDMLLRQFAVTQVLQDFAADAANLAEPDEETVRSFFEEDPEQFRVVCTRMLFVTTEAQALQARGRIAAGESFETVTTEMAVDPDEARGGVLQCLSARSLPEEIADALTRAQPATLLAPVKVADGYYVVFYQETREPSLDTARDLVREQIATNPQVKLQLLVQRAVRVADVEVNPEFGVWTGDLQSPVVPRTPASNTGEEDLGTSPQDRARREELLSRLPSGFLDSLTPQQRARVDTMALDQLEALVTQMSQSLPGETVVPQPDPATPGVTPDPAAPGVTPEPVAPGPATPEQ